MVRKVTKKKRSLKKVFPLIPTLLGLVGIIATFGFINFANTTSYISRADESISLGVMGDSTSDEYRADNNRGGAYASTTFNWVELLARHRNVNVGPWGTWGGPRRTGYKHNWARSGATTTTVISDGQHTGLAQQVANGEVTHVVFLIGGNDFAWWNGSYQEVYNGTISDTQLQQKINSMISNISKAITTVHSAGPVKMVVSGVPDIGSIPTTQAAMPDPIKRKRVTDAINKINAGIAQTTTPRGIPIFDANAFGVFLYSSVNQNGYFPIGGELINFYASGDNPRHMILGDNIHAGTVANGILANKLFVEMFNTHYGSNIVPFSDNEILSNAGIKVAQSPTPTSVVSQSPTPTSAPRVNTPTPTRVPRVNTPTPTPTRAPRITSNPVTPIPNIPASISNSPFYYEIKKGNQFYGLLNNLKANDNKYFVVKSTTGSSSTSQVDFGFNGFTSNEPVKITVNTSFRASFPSTTIKTYIYNIANSSFDLIETRSVGFRKQSNSTDITIDPYRYINSSGQLGIRIESTNSRTHYLLTDFIQVQIQ